MESIIDLQTLVAGLKDNTLTFSADKPVHVCFNSDMSLLDEPVRPERDGLVSIRAKAYHDGVNLNGSKIECDTFKEKSYTMYTRPILANVIADEDGKKDFGSHDRRYSFDEDGNLIEEIIEKPIGCIESVWFEEDPAQGVTRAIVDGCLWQDYAQDAVDILNDRGQVNCSVELSIKAMRFEEDTVILDDYFVMGLTLLGEKFEPGMAGSTASTKSFVTEPQKKDEDDQELLDTVEEEEAEALKKQQEEEERQRQEEEERRQSGDSASVQDGPSLVKNTPKSSKAVEKAKAAPASKEEAKPENKPEPEVNEESDEPKEEVSEPSKETALNALILESLNMVLVSDDKGEFIYLHDYSGDPANPLAGEPKEVCVVDMETMTRFSNEQKELADFKANYARAEKEAILNDPLYQSLRESEAFKAIESELDTLSKDEIDHKCLAAFAQSKKEERIEPPYAFKAFGAQNVRPVQDAYLEERYGNIFSK